MRDVLIQAEGLFQYLSINIFFGIFHYFSNLLGRFWLAFVKALEDELATKALPPG